MFKAEDLFIVPICYFILYMIFKPIAGKYDPVTQKLFMRAFHFKMLCSILFAIITDFVYNGGDSEMFFFATLDIQKALGDDAITLWEVLKTEKVNETHPLSPYFYMNNAKYPTYGYMVSSSNFFVPRVSVLLSMLFFNSYLSICMVFSFFALGGTIRLYKFFIHHYPDLQLQIAFATLFIPSVCYWSSGLLKDSLCLGAVGLLCYGLLNVFVHKRAIFKSVAWTLISVVILVYVKAYILLAFLPGLMYWLTTRLGNPNRKRQYNRMLNFFSLVLAVVFGYFLINTITSNENLQSFQLDNLAENTDKSRGQYESIVAGSNFKLETSNRGLLLANGVVATFFRPFIWEVSSPIVLASALESLIFSWLILYFFIKKGVLRFFKSIVTNPVTILCGVFAILFAAFIGSSAANFGTLSRYKIPCMPFFLMLLFLIYKHNDLSIPKIIRSIAYWLTQLKPPVKERRRATPPVAELAT